MKEDFEDFIKGWLNIFTGIALITTVLLFFRFIFVPTRDHFGDFAVFLFISGFAFWYTHKDLNLD